MIEVKLRRVFWAWHFWTGLIAAPVLIILSITGALYVFKPEIEVWWYDEIASAEFDIQTDSLNDCVTAAMRSVGEGYGLYGLEIEHGTGRAPAVLAMANDGSHQIRRIYVDPRQNRVLGEIPEPNFFTVVLAIHRRLLAGTPGRVLTELTTGWTIAITLIGIILWWPRSWRRLSGILVPRLSGKRYVQLRDLHSIGGTAISSIVIVISITGLLYALVWGGLFQVTGFLSGQFDVVLDPPQSLSDTSQDKISVDDVVTRLRELSLPTARVSIAMGQIESDPITIESGQHWGPSVTRLVHLDRRSGEILANQRLSNLPPMAIYTQWNYPLHVGSIAGLTTKIIWIVAAIGLALLPILGIAMWLTRRRPGKTGVPKRTEAVHPGWLKAIIALLAISLPTVGLSMLAVAAVGWYRQHRQNRSNSLSG